MVRKRKNIRVSCYVKVFFKVFCENIPVCPESIPGKFSQIFLGFLSGVECRLRVKYHITILNFFIWYYFFVMEFSLWFFLRSLRYSFHNFLGLASTWLDFNLYMFLEGWLQRGQGLLPWAFADGIFCSSGSKLSFLCCFLPVLSNF